VTMAVKPRRARGGHHGPAPCSGVHFQSEVIARKHSAGDIVQMNQRRAALLREGPHHAPRGLLRVHVQTRAALDRGKTQGQTGA
jgi:hypothetical protein